MMLICIKQHLSNIWNSILEKVKQHWEAGLKKKALLVKKKRVYHCHWDKSLPKWASMGACEHLKIIHILHPRYHPKKKKKGIILKNKL